MSDEHLSRAEISELIVGIWTAIAGLSPSERESKMDEIQKLLDRSAGKCPRIYSDGLEDRILEVTGIFTQAGLAQMGSANVWPDTPAGLFKTIFDGAILSALAALPDPKNPENWVTALEALVPVGKRFLEQLGPNKGRSEVERDLTAIMACLPRTWKWSSDDGEDFFPPAIEATGLLVEGLIQQGQHASFTANEIEWAMDAIHYQVDQCIDEAFRKNAKLTAKALETRLKKATHATLGIIQSLNHPPLDRNEIARVFEQQWNGSK